MWKKALWIYLGLYVLGIIYSIVNFLIRSSNEGDFQPVSLIFPLLMFVPVAVVAAALRGKKISIILTLFGLLIVSVPVVGIFNFNDFDLVTIGKVLIFVPMLVALLYFGYQRLFGKTPAPESSS